MGSKWVEGSVKGLINPSFIFLGARCSTYFHGALNSLQCVSACLCPCSHYGVWKLKRGGEKQPIVSADWDFGVALTKICTEVTGSNFILPTSKSYVHGRVWVTLFKWWQIAFVSLRAVSNLGSVFCYSVFVTSGCCIFPLTNYAFSRSTKK